MLREKVCRCVMCFMYVNTRLAWMLLSAMKFSACKHFHFGDLVIDVLFRFAVALEGNRYARFESLKNWRLRFLLGISPFFSGDATPNILNYWTIQTHTFKQCISNSQNTTGMLSYATLIYQNEGGIPPFYSGVTTSAIQSATEKALYFFAYTFFKNGWVHVTNIHQHRSSCLQRYFILLSHIHTTFYSNHVRETASLRSNQLTGMLT